jgi:hypothetical protein
MSRHLVLLYLAFFALDASAQDAATPVTLRAISVPPDAVASVLPSGIYTDMIDVAAMQRIERAIREGRAKIVTQVQRSVAIGKKESFGQSKNIKDGDLTRMVGFVGSIEIGKSTEGPGETGSK